MTSTGTVAATGPPGLSIGKFDFNMCFCSLMCQSTSVWWCLKTTCHSSECRMGTLWHYLNLICVAQIVLAHGFLISTMKQPISLSPGSLKLLRCTITLCMWVWLVGIGCILVSSPDHTLYTSSERRSGVICQFSWACRAIPPTWKCDKYS